jgi:hypothetical protein
MYTYVYTYCTTTIGPLYGSFRLKRNEFILSVGGIALQVLNITNLVLCCFRVQFFDQVYSSGIRRRPHVSRTRCVHFLGQC